MDLRVSVGMKEIREVTVRDLWTSVWPFDWQPVKFLKDKGDVVNCI